MADTTYPSRGDIRLRAYPSNAFANYRWPTVAELNAGLRLEDAVPWDDFDFGVQASETNDNPPISAKSLVQSRGAANYGGTIPFWYPGYYTDTANDLVDIFDLFVPDDDGYDRPVVYIVMSVDGEIGEAGQPADTFAFANGDLVSVFRCQADAWTDAITGDDNFGYSLNFLRNGALAVYTSASTTAPVLVTPTTASADISDGDRPILTATVNGRPWNGGVVWTVSDPAVASVSKYGVVTPLSAGSATITGSLIGAAATDTTSLTVTA